MTMLPVPGPNSEISPLPRVGTRDLFAALLADSRSPHTRAGRDHDCRGFARFLGQADPAAALALFVASGRANGNAIALAYRRSELDRGCAAATVNRRLATLRRAVRLARRFELIDWEIDIEDLRVVKRRDTRGPGDSGWRALWKAALDRGDSPKAQGTAPSCVSCTPTHSAALKLLGWTGRMTSICLRPESRSGARGKPARNGLRFRTFAWSC